LDDREQVEWFLDEDDFSTCTSWDLKHRAREGMLLVDSAGRAWRVVRVEPRDRVGSSWMRALRFLLQQNVYRVSQQLIEDTPLRLPEIQKRVCTSIAANPDRWRDDELIAGEDGPLVDEQRLLDQMQDDVRKTKTLAQLINVLWDQDLPD
jgi:hypothetical protein